jgi:hypothetical protein
MTLAPASRVLLTDALQPPAGYSVEIAVGTTYSMNLISMLLAPLSFALFDQADYGELDRSGAKDRVQVDPIRVLDATRRYAEHTSVFCQAGGIHLPSYRHTFTFIEDCILQVVPRHQDGIFHPKVWALRFVNREGGNRRHRLVVLSRNMTLDRSWDTALVLDEASWGQIDAAPAAEFVLQLPVLARAAGTTVPDARLREIRDLATSLGGARLVAPDPAFNKGKLLPIGLTDEEVWPFPRGSKLLAISPFLTRPAVQRLAEVSDNRIIVSRPEAFELIGAQALAGWSAKVLQQAAESGSLED